MIFSGLTQMRSCYWRIVSGRWVLKLTQNAESCAGDQTSQSRESHINSGLRSSTTRSGKSDRLCTTVAATHTREIRSDTPDGLWRLLLADRLG